MKKNVPVPEVIIPELLGLFWLIQLNLSILTLNFVGLLYVNFTWNNYSSNPAGLNLQL